LSEYIQVQRLKEQLKESQRMIEEMNLHWQEQLREQVVSFDTVIGLF
jgi:hypothetical protein